MPENFYALIMAGGGGTRLWPLSRQNRPKQSLPLIGDKTMFRISIERLAPLFKPEQIFIITGKNHVDALRDDAPEIPTENFLVEPFGMDSGPAAGFGTSHIAQQDPDAVVAVLTSDHYIADTAGFCNALEAAYQIAQEGHIVTLGIAPTFPATGFGYIKRGDFLYERNNLKIYISEGFREKPDEATARRFIQSGTYSWNAGMFIWKADQALQEFEQQSPGTYRGLETIRQAYNSPTYQKTIDSTWGKMDKLSVDYAIMEKAEKVAVIPIEVGWSDIGSWSSLYELLANQDAENIAHGKNCEHIAHDSSGTIVVSDKVVVTIGLEDMAVVDTPDVLLICPRNRDQDVRAVVKKLREEGRQSIL